MEATRSSETSVYNKCTRRHIPFLPTSGLALYMDTPVHAWGDENTESCINRPEEKTLYGRPGHRWA
jgi:hypothetical protein